MSHPPLPIDRIRRELLELRERGPVVVTAPTGSGKSTQVPRWCRERGPVLVVEPRRVACRSLAQRVAGLEGRRLGSIVGYSVRDEHRASGDTEILFATTGVVLRMLGTSDLGGYATIILDELHERSLDLDLLLALLLDRRPEALVVMSATLAGERVAEHIGGRLLHAPGRLFPVDVDYHPGSTLLPDVRGLEGRLRGALDRIRADRDDDVLVFLPGKAEIAGAAEALGRRRDLDLIPLHGGLSLEQQSRAFAPSDRHKVILATNVAETSITVPGVGAVIDSGLVRRTRYHQGRGFLTLQPVARDSAEQRAGRAGRTAPGVCLRLWSEAALLEATTPPEIHREGLVPLVLAAAACGALPESLPFLDPPTDYALEAARDELTALGALDEHRRLTERGRQIFGLPLDASLGRLLIEAEGTELLPEVIDLVAALSTGRPVFKGSLDPRHEEDDDPRAAGCDATALIRAVRSRRRSWAKVTNHHVLAEARNVSRRLRGAYGLPQPPIGDRPGDGGPNGGPAAPVTEAEVDRRRLAEVALAADPRCAHVARRRRGKVAWSNGGTEIRLGRESAVDPTKVEAVAVLDLRPLGRGKRGTEILATCAVPLEIPWLVEAGLGSDRMRQPAIRRGQVVARIERVYARKVLAVREEIPQGALAREAIRDLFLQGELFPEDLGPTRSRLEAAALVRRLREANRAEGPLVWGEVPPEVSGPEVESLGGWVLERLEDLGVERGEDLALLEPGDLLAPELPAEMGAWLDRAFPRDLSLGDAVYHLTYDLKSDEVTLNQEQGRRRVPPLSYLPSFPGLRIVLRDKHKRIVIRER